MMTAARAFCAGTLCVATATVMQAQNTNKVQIDLGYCQTAPKEIWVVLDGDEKHKFPAPTIDRMNYWIGYVKHRKFFAAENSRASLRLGTGRTICGKGTPIEDREDKNNPWRWVARFSFDCSEQPVHEVELRTDKNTIPLGYVRSLPGSDCTDWAFFEDGPKTIKDVWNSEEVRALVGWTKEIHEPYGLKVLSPAGVLTFSRSAKRHGRRNNNTLVFNRDGIIIALADQRATGDGSAPTFSAPAMDINFEYLRNAGVTTFTVTITK